MAMGTDDYRTAAQYQFGHTDLAARRLGEVARVFRPSTEAFLRDAAPSAARTVFDLGCGPGYTTRLLAEALPQALVTGLDLSPEFLTIAGASPPPRIRYLQHDVAGEPLPSPPADLAFCRYLLSHLAKPTAALAGWGAGLAPGGLLLAEEVEAIHPELPVFRTYLGIVAEMLADQGSELYVGPALSATAEPDGMERCFDRVLQLPVAAQDAATMFSMNVPNWKDRPFIRQRFSSEEIAALQAELDRVARTGGGEPVLWELRQIGWRRRA
jgi:SAM-dependent methyltransferase